MTVNRTDRIIIINYNSSWPSAKLTNEHHQQLINAWPLSTRHECYGVCKHSTFSQFMIIKTNKLATSNTTTKQKQHSTIIKTFVVAHLVFEGLRAQCLNSLLQVLLASTLWTLRSVPKRKRNRHENLQRHHFLRSRQHTPWRGISGSINQRSKTEAKGHFLFEGLPPLISCPQQKVSILYCCQRCGFNCDETIRWHRLGVTVVRTEWWSVVVLVLFSSWYRSWLGQSQHCIPNAAFKAQLCSAKSHTNPCILKL